MQNKILVGINIFLVILVGVGFFSALSSSPYQEKDISLPYQEKDISFGAPSVCYPYQGCTGTSTNPGAGQILIGRADGSGVYDFIVSSTLSGAGGADSDWIQSGSTLTVTSTVSIVTASGTVSSTQLYVNSSGTIVGLNFTNATGTRIGITTASTTGTEASSTLRLQYTTASRILQSDAGRVVQAVADLTSWIAGTASEITVTDDGDGTVTLSLPTIVNLGASSELRVVSSTISGNLTAPNVSSTNITASGYGVFPLLGFTSATGTNLTITTLLDSQGTKFVTSTNAAVYPIHFCFANEISNIVDMGKQFISTSTIGTTILAGNFKSGDGTSAASGTVTFNLGFATSTSNSTSSWQKLFTSDQAVTSDGTASVLSVNGSTTWSGASGQRWLLGYYTTANSSSSQFCVDGQYTTP